MSGFGRGGRGAELLKVLFSNCVVYCQIKRVYCMWTSFCMTRGEELNASLDALGLPKIGTKSSLL